MAGTFVRSGVIVLVWNSRNKEADEWNATGFPWDVPRPRTGAGAGVSASSRTTE